MTKYSKQLVLDYINYNDIDIPRTELEQDPEFMMEVISLTKDKDQCIFCSEDIKTNYEFVRFIMDTFSDDKRFVSKFVDMYTNKHGKDDLKSIELLILLNNMITDDKSNLELLYYQSQADAFYNDMKTKIKNSMKSESHQEIIEKSGSKMGFIYITSNYKESDIIKDFIAKKMINEVFYQDEHSALESLAHNQYDSYESFKNKVSTSYLVNYLDNYDTYLASYAACNKDLLNDTLKDFSKIKENWDSYEKQGDGSNIISINGYKSI